MNNDMQKASTSANLTSSTPNNDYDIFLDSKKTMTHHYITEAKENGLLSEEEVIALAKAKDAGDIQAKNKLIESNLLLVVSIVRQINMPDNISEDDLIQDGNLGLITAVERYDYTKGVKFATYAAYWIKQSIYRALSQKSKTIRIPNDKNTLFFRMNKFENDFFSIHGYNPTLETVAEEFNLDLETIAQVKLSYSITSLSQIIKRTDSETEFGTFVADEKSLQELENVEYNDFKEALMRSLKDLTDPKEFYILVKRYGLYDGEKHTLEEIGELMGITRERVRQVEARVLKRLSRNPTFKANFQNVLS